MSRHLLPLLLFIALGAIACKSGGAPPAEPDATEEVKTPVDVVSVSPDTLSEYIDLNATSTYLQVNIIKSQTNGYLRTVNLQPGQRVSAGQTAFMLQTKESKALGNTINSLDTSFHFSGIITIRSAASGYVQELNHQAGDYVQDGEQLAVISDSRSFGFLLSVPVELIRYVTQGQGLDIALPDGTNVHGKVSSIMPTIDSVSQSEQVLVRVDQSGNIPRNIIGRVRITKMRKNNIQVLPKAAILSDESQSNFWVMKMIDSTTAIRVPVTRGMVSGDKVEITAPAFTAGDKIIVSGNYGLADTAKVTIRKPEQ